MKVIPRRRQTWFEMLLFPFKACVVAAPVCLFIWRLATKGQRVRGTSMEAAFPIAVGLLLCVGVLVIGALIQFWGRNPDRALASLGFAVAAFAVLHFWVLPLCAS